MRKLLKDYPMNEWIEAADRCESCGVNYEVRVHWVDESGAFGDVEWRVSHKVECPEVTEYFAGSPVTETSSMDIAGWEFMDEPITLRGEEIYP